MSEAATSESTAVVNYQEQLRQELAQLSKTVEPPSSNVISTKGKLFRVPDGRQHPGPLKVVILDYTSYNVVYKGAYNPNVKSPPICWAIGKDIKALAPSPSAPLPQHTSCDGCPKNAWGSGPNGSGRACKNQRRLLVVSHDLKGPVMTLYVSPSALKNWDSYIRELGTEHGKLPIQVVTDITFDANESYPKLEFAFADYNTRVEDAMRLRLKSQEMLTREPDTKDEAA